MAKFDMRTYLNKSSQPQQMERNKPNSNVKMISVYDLVPNPRNFYELNDIEKLEIAIELQGGITTSLEVKAIENNKYMLIAGHRRRQAMVNILERGSEKIKSDKVPCIIKEFETTEQEIVAIIFSNKYQRVRSKEEELKEFQLLKPILKNIYDKEKATGNISGRFRKFCAEFFDVSESTIHRIESMEKLTPEIKQEINKGKITPTAAVQLTSLSASEQKAVYEDTTKQGKTTVKAIQEQKENLKKLEDEGQTTIYDTNQENLNEYKQAATKNFVDMLQKEIETAANDMQKSTDEEEQKYISAYIEVLGRYLEIAQNEAN